MTHPYLDTAIFSTIRNENRLSKIFKNDPQTLVPGKKWIFR